MMSGSIKLGRNEIAGYPSSPSVQAGEVLGLHVATAAHRFRADFYRVGWRPRLMGSAVWCGERVLPGSYDEDWQWPRWSAALRPRWRRHGCSDHSARVRGSAVAAFPPRLVGLPVHGPDAVAG